MSLNNQKEYWNRVADSKTFTHTVNFQLFESLVNKEICIIDYGCGYGRIVKQLIDLSYTNVTGFDTSFELIDRGKRGGNLPIYCIDEAHDLPLENGSADCILLFAVLTCIPSNQAQLELINILYSKLAIGGLLYVSDYYLQESLDEVKEYHYFNNDEDNFGVFSLDEGATFRHHTKAWIRQLFSKFSIISNDRIRVKTMNGSNADAFQMFLRK